MKDERATTYTVEFDLADLSIEQIKSCIKMGLNPLTIDQIDLMEWAVRSKNIEIIKLMEEQNMIDANEELSHVLNRCICDNDIELAEYILSNGVIPTEEDVITALKNGHVKLAKRLIQMVDDEEE